MEQGNCGSDAVACLVCRFTELGYQTLLNRLVQTAVAGSAWHAGYIMTCLVGRQRLRLGQPAHAMFTLPSGGD